MVIVCSLNLALNVSNSVIGVNAYIWQRSIVYSMSNTQEGARGWCSKANYPKDLNALITKNFPDNIWFAHRFPTSTYTQKGRGPYLS